MVRFDHCLVLTPVLGPVGFLETIFSLHLGPYLSLSVGGCKIFFFLLTSSFTGYREVVSEGQVVTLSQNRVSLLLYGILCHLNFYLNRFLNLPFGI